MTGRFSLAAITAIGGLAGGMAAGAFPYPVAGVDGDPDFCSSRSEPVMFCVTPPANTHCEVLVSEETPLYLGYRYVCEPASLTQTTFTQKKAAPVMERTP